MKFFWTILLLFILSHAAKAQRQATDKIYWVALEKYTHILDSLNTNKKVIYLEERGTYIDSIPASINGYQIIPLTSSNIFKIYKEHNNHLTQTYISPVQVKDNELEIVFIPFQGILKGRKFSLGNGGGTSIFFKLDSIARQFVFYKSKTSGI